MPGEVLGVDIYGLSPPAGHCPSRRCGAFCLIASLPGEAQCTSQ